MNRERPALPGTTSIVVTLLEFARRQAIAYSRPPPPSTRQLSPGAPADRRGLRALRCSQIFLYTASPPKIPFRLMTQTSAREMRTRSSHDVTPHRPPAPRI